MAAEDVRRKLTILNLMRQQLQDALGELDQIAVELTTTYENFYNADVQFQPRVHHM